jgi:uncharacterized protein
MYNYMVIGYFEWDERKNHSNYEKHGVDFETATLAFNDKGRLIYTDKKHSQQEKRWYCIGKVKGGILTVRFTYRNMKIRIIGAGYWRQGKKLYDQENRLH